VAGCVFCAISAGEAPASLVHEDEVALACMDVHPINEGHVLVVPREHAASLAELDPEAGAHVFRVAQRVAGGLRESGLRCEGVNLFLADGEAAGQDVFHVHLHVLPRFEGDNLLIKPREGFGRPDREALDDLAARLRL